MKFEDATVKLWGMEPAMITSAVVALLTLFVSFGAPITGEQREAIIGVVSAALAVLGGYVIRQQVAPKKKVEAAMGSTALPRIAAVETKDIGTMGTLRA